MIQNDPFLRAVWETRGELADAISLEQLLQPYGCNYLVR